MSIAMKKLPLNSSLQACCVEYIILESDNLSSLFPNARLNLGGFVMNSHQLFALLATIAILPTVWLRDLTMLSYISGKSSEFSSNRFSSNFGLFQLILFPCCLLSVCNMRGTLSCAIFVSSWWSYCFNIGSPLLVLGWFGG